MIVSPLQIVIIISTVIFFLFGVDLYKRKKMNFLHFLVFFAGAGAVIAFSINIGLLNRFGGFFGVSRGAELLTYIGVIILFYLYIDLLNKQIRDKHQLTKFVSYHAIQAGFEEVRSLYSSWKNQGASDDYVFLIRAYNESRTLGSVVDELFAHGYRKIVMVNDGSADDTFDIMYSLRDKYPQHMIVILNHTINRGGGSANKTLFQFVKKNYALLQSKWYVTYDADGQMSIGDMKSFHHAIAKFKDVDIFYGSRFIAGADRKTMPWTRKCVLFIAKSVTFLFYGSRISDPHNGYRVLSLQAVQAIDIISDGMHYANELVEQIRHKCISYHEVPTNTVYTDHSLHKAHAQKSFHSIRIGLEMIYKKLFFR